MPNYLLFTPSEFFQFFNGKKDSRKRKGHIFLTAWKFFTEWCMKIKKKVLLTLCLFCVHLIKEVTYFVQNIIFSSSGNLFAHLFLTFRNVLNKRMNRNFTENAQVIDRRCRKRRKREREKVVQKRKYI